jgi:hypothetical protein
MVGANCGPVEVLWVFLEYPDGLLVASHLLLAWTWSCHMDIPAHHIGQAHTSCTYLCGNPHTKTQGLEQDVEIPCVGKPQP